MTSKPIEDTVCFMITMLVIVLILMWLTTITIAWQVTQRYDTYWPSVLIATPVVEEGGR